MLKGTFIAQIIGVIGSIFLAKIYGSEAYGLFGLYISISSVLTIINTLQLDKSLVTLKSESESESENLMNSLFLSTLIIALIFFILYYFISFFFDLNLFNIGIVAISILSSIIYSFNSIHESFLTFKKKFHPISIVKIYTVVFNITLQILLYNKFKLMGLVYGNTFSIILITVFYFFKNQNHLKKIDLGKLKKSIISNSSIVKYIFPSTLLNSLAINLMPILILTFFSLKDSGVYFLSLKILAVPLFLISSSTSQVYYQKSSEMLYDSKEKLFALTKQLVLTNLGIMLVFVIVINTIGIYFLEFIFDKNWENLRLFTFILSFLILARSSFNPISNIIIVLNKNHISLLFNSYLLIINLAAISFGYFSNSLTKTIITLSIFGGLGYITLLFYFMKKLKDLKLKHG